MKKAAVSKSIKQLFRIRPNSEWLVFFWCLLLATVFWFLKTLNENYDSIVSFDVVYANVPEDKTFTRPLPERILVSVEAQGWELLSFHFLKRRNRINIDIGELANTNFLLTSQKKAAFARQLSGDVIISDISPDTIHFHLDKLVEKEVAVSVNKEIEFMRQFGLSGPVSVEPEYVKIKGAEKFISEINKIETDPILIHNANKNYSVESKLAYPDFYNLSYSHDNVVVNIPVEKLTEQSFQLKIELLHNEVEGSETIILIPSSTRITFQTALSNYDKYGTEHFRVIADLRERERLTGNQARIELVEKPDFVYSIRLQPEFVNFLIQR